MQRAGCKTMVAQHGTATPPGTISLSRTIDHVTTNASRVVTENRLGKS